MKVNLENQRQELKEAIQRVLELNEKIEVKLPIRRKPRIILFNVPASSGDEDLVKDMYLQNHFIKQNCSQEVFQREVKVLSTFQGKHSPPDKYVILSTISFCKNLILQQDRVAVSWETVVVKDHLPLIRCFKCCGYTHISKYCDERNRCSHCTGWHAFKECDKLNDTPACINCKKANKSLPPEARNPTDHNAFSWQYPILNRMRPREAKRIDFWTFACSDWRFSFCPSP